MKKLFNLILIVVVIAAVVVPGFADEKCCGKSKKVEACKQEKDTKCCDIAQLKLTEKQQAEFDTMHKVCIEKKTGIHEELARLKREKIKLMAAEKPDQNAIDNAIEAIGKLTTEGKKMMAGCQLKVKALLNPDQLKAWDKMQGCCGHAVHMKKEHKEHKEIKVHKEVKHVTDCSASCPSHSAKCEERNKKG